MSLPDRVLSPAELEELADELLRGDGARECCRSCDGYGAPTGSFVDVAQAHHDGSGRQLIIGFPLLSCLAGHEWFAGEGRPRGITSGPAPVLLEEHLRERRTHEIYCEAGTPDPGIVSGMYWRSHPEGRQISTDGQRKETGAGFFR